MKLFDGCGTASTPVVRYYPARRISEYGYLRLPPEMFHPAGRFGPKASVTVLADGTAIIGHPNLIPCAEEMHWRDLDGLLDPPVLEADGETLVRKHIPPYVPAPEEFVPDPGECVDTEEDGQYVMFTPEELYAIDCREGTLPDEGIQTGFSPAKRSNRQTGKEDTDGMNEKKEKNAAAAEIIGRSVHGLALAVEALQACMRDLNSLGVLLAEEGA